METTQHSALPPVSASCSGSRSRVEAGTAGPDPPKAKKGRTQAAQGSSAYMPMCYLTSMPFELLSEIFSYSATPKDLLAVARTCQHFCATLVNKRSNHIWRNVRRNVQPEPIPNPTPNFTEASYASFLFDGGHCEVCGRATRRLYDSLALRIRLCGKSECRWDGALIPSGSDDQMKLLRSNLVPELESSRFHYPGQPISEWPTMNFAFRCWRKEDVHRIERAHRASGQSMDAFLETQRPQREKVIQMMSLFVTLSCWQDQRSAALRANKARNHNLAKRFAEHHGWIFRDMEQTFTYTMLSRACYESCEEMTERALEMAFPQIQADHVKNMAHRVRQTDENVYRRQRQEVEERYNQIKSTSVQDPMPTLALFRQLPAAKLLQLLAKDKILATHSVEHADQSMTSARGLIDEELEDWRQMVRAEMANILGFAEWNSISADQLHPVDRATAWFQCSICQKNGRRHYLNPPLDFAQACAHICPQADKKIRAKDIWAAKKFVKDEKAIAAVTKVLELCRTSTEEQASFDTLEGLGSRICCLSCDSPIFMNFRSLLCHSHRHEHMELVLLPVAAVTRLTVHPPDQGLITELSAKNDYAKGMRQLLWFACGHCRWSAQPKLMEWWRQSKSLVIREDQRTAECSAHTVAGPSSANKGGAEQASVGDVHDLEEEDPATAEMIHQVFTFGGLKSHLYSKHGVRDVRDEDFFCPQGRPTIALVSAGTADRKKATNEQEKRKGKGKGKPSAKPLNINPDDL